jgi:4-hydroxy-2-oxoheptanedioate aldolase
MMSGIRAILRNSMKEKLARDEVVASMTVRLARSIEMVSPALSVLRGLCPTDGCG